MKEISFQKENPVGRGLGTVAHFFLSDRDSREDVHRNVGPEEGSAKKHEGITIPGTQSEICFVLCPDGLTPQASLLGCMIALSMAASGMSVGLIETTTKLPHTFFLSGGYENLDAIFWETDLDSPDFLRVISRFRKTCDFLFINTAASVLLTTASHTGLIGKCLVVTTVRSRDLLNACGTIKKALKKWAAVEIEFVVVKQHPADNAVEAVAVLENMTNGFPPCSVRFVGAVTLPEGVDVFGALSLEPLPRIPAEIADETVTNIARHFIVSGDLRKKRERLLEE